MDIHAPEGPTRSFKDFAIHILIVTVGILIALGLDGIRASVHEHNLLVETRTTFRTELGLDRKRLVDETANVKDKECPIGQYPARLSAAGEESGRATEAS